MSLGKALTSVVGAVGHVQVLFYHAGVPILKVP